MSESVELEADEVVSATQVARKAWDVYASTLRVVWETPENLGKLLLVDATTGNAVLDDEQTQEAANELYAQNPEAQPFGIRIGYNAAYTLGGVLELIAKPGEDNGTDTEGEQ